jgi:hypothetical protein
MEIQHMFYNILVGMPIIFMGVNGKRTFQSQMKFD